jgi:hypothetical protein
MATSEDTRLSTAVFRTFEQLRHIDDQGRDYWSGREFAQALGYESFDRFRPVLRKARISCKRSDTLIRNHFWWKRMPGSTDMDIRLSRHACYIVLQCADPAYPQVALGKNYLALQTRRYELRQTARQAIHGASQQKQSDTSFDQARQIFIQTLAEAKIEREDITDFQQALQLYQEVERTVIERFPSVALSPEQAHQ